MENPVKVVDKNEGPKIPWEQDGTRLYFGDEEAVVNAKKAQRDWPVEIDIMMDNNGNLVTGGGVFYVAQVALPPIEYVNVPAPEDSATEGETVREPVPIDMADVTVTLWSLTGAPAAI